MQIKPTQPKLNLIEHVALELAGVFYDTGRSQGLKSKYKNARAYAYANLEKFVPHAVKTLLDQLNNSSISAEAKDEIMESLLERVNDPMAKSLADASANHALPDIDIAKLIPVKELPTVIHDKRAIADYEGARGLAFKRR